jgi:nucleotide-binding universal stress UspA family protein
LVPLDGSKYSKKALEKAILIAKKFDGKITLIHIYSVSKFAISPTQVYNYVQDVQKYGKKVLAEGKKIIDIEGIPVEKILKEGHVVEEIIKTSENGKVDSIIMGARGLSPIKEIILGSVSHGVINHAKCPVLVLK